MKLEERQVFDQNHEDMDGVDSWNAHDTVILDTVKEVFRISAPLRRPQDTGGVFLMTYNVMDNNDDGSVELPYTIREDDPRLEETIGVLGPNDAECPRIVREKAERLLNTYVESDRRYHCSWQTRDLAKKQYGGAILAHDWVLSFSGCSEMMDEAICLCVARVTGLHNQTDAEYIAAITGNELYPKLMELVTAQLK